MAGAVTAAVTLLERKGREIDISILSDYGTLVNGEQMKSTETVMNLNAAARLCRIFVCGICFQPLTPDGEGVEYVVRCYEHGIMIPDTLVSKRRANQIEGERSAANIELLSEARKNKPPRSEEEILRDLGF